MASDEELNRLKALIQRHDRELGELNSLNAYYEGDQPLSYMAEELLAELDERIRQVVINWPQLVVDSLEERLDVRGFRLAGQAKADERMTEWWQANDLDTESQLGHIDTLTMKRAYLLAGTDGDRAHDEDRGDELEDDIPLITVESPLEVYAERDPRTRRVASAVKRFKDDDGGLATTPTEHATLYVPNSTIWFEKQRGAWTEVDRDEHNLGIPPVWPLVNRARTSRRGGVSELKAVLPLSDAACKIATDMMVSAEYHAIPRRVAFGVEDSDFTDERGNPVSALSRVIGRVWSIAAKKGDADVIQFPEASLANFHQTINTLAAIVASLSGLPPHFLGLSTDNPASADAIRSAESRLIKRAERRQLAYGGSWEMIMRIADRIINGEWDPNLRRLETVWRDAATPTIAQAADAAVKKFQAGIVPLRQTREDLGYTEEQIRRMEEADAEEDPLRLPPGDPAAGIGPKPPIAQGEPGTTDVGVAGPAGLSSTELSSTELPSGELASSGYPAG